MAKRDFTPKILLSKCLVSKLVQLKGAIIFKNCWGPKEYVAFGPMFFHSRKRWQRRFGIPNILLSKCLVSNLFFVFELLMRFDISKFLWLQNL